jgi:hypothetical protein
MHLRAFLGDYPLVSFFKQPLQSNDVIKLLERFAIDVIYRFDRLREGTSDRCVENGLRCR